MSWPQEIKGPLTIPISSNPDQSKKDNIKTHIVPGAAEQLTDDTRRMFGLADQKLWLLLWDFDAKQNLGYEDKGKRFFGG